MGETWKNVSGFSGYQVSSAGNVRSRRASLCSKGMKGFKSILESGWHPLKTMSDKDGYRFVNLYCDGKMSPKRIYILVLETFIGPRPSGLVACHNNGISSDDRLENLRWDTPRSNHDDAIKHGSKRGVKNGRAKLTPNKVREMRKLHSLGVNYVELGKMFQITNTHARCVVKRMNWSHIE